jgi:hypothetical protein
LSRGAIHSLITAGEKDMETSTRKWIVAGVIATVIGAAAAVIGLITDNWSVLERGICGLLR